MVFPVLRRAFAIRWRCSAPDKSKGLATPTDIGTGSPHHSGCGGCLSVERLRSPGDSVSRFLRVYHHACAASQYEASVRRQQEFKGVSGGWALANNMRPAPPIAGHPPQCQGAQRDAPAAVRLNNRDRYRAKAWKRDAATVDMFSAERWSNVTTADKLTGQGGFNVRPFPLGVKSAGVILRSLSTA